MQRFMAAIHALSPTQGHFGHRQQDRPGSPRSTSNTSRLTTGFMKSFYHKSAMPKRPWHKWTTQFSALSIHTSKAQAVFNISDWAPQTVHASPAASRGSVWADYMQRLRTATGLKIMILIYETTWLWLHLLPTEKRKTLQMNSQILPRHFHMLFWPQFIFPAELYDRKWLDKKVATTYSWGDINKGTKLIIIKGRQIPPALAGCLPGGIFFPSKE